MPVGFFLDKDHSPTRKEMDRAMGAKAGLFRMLWDFMKQAYGMEGEWSYGGKNYGWNVWYRKSGKTLVNLFPQKGYLVAQVVLGKEQVEKAADLPLGKTVRAVFDRAPQFHDGRWLYIPVKTKRDTKDVQTLILTKRKPIT